MDYSTDQVLVRYLEAGSQAQLHEDIISDKASFDLEASASVLLNQGYEILESDLPQGDFEQTLTKNVYTVYLRERITIVFPSQPRSEGEPVEGFEGLFWPAGLEEHGLKRSCSRTVVYRYEDGSDALEPVIETVTFERTAMVNHVTHQVTYMPWQPIGSSGFGELVTPELLGYQADLALVEARDYSDADAVLEDEHITVTFAKESQKAVLRVLDASKDEVLFSENLSGLTNDAVDYPVANLVSLYLSQGYEVLENPFEEQVYFSVQPDQVQEFTLTLRPRELELGLEDLPEAGTPVYPELENSVLWPDQLAPHYLTKTVKRTLLNQHEDGTLIEAVEQTVDFVRRARVNLLTQEVLYTPWTLASEQASFSAYTPEAMTGYVPRPRHIPEIEVVDAESSDLRVIITYTRKIQRVIVQFVDTASQDMVLHQAQLVGKTGQPLTFDYAKKVQEFLNNGYEVVASDYPEEAIFQADLPENAVYTISLAPKVVVVYPDDPKAAGTYIDPGKSNGPKWPVGVDEQSLRRLVTRTIYHRYETGRDAISPRVDAVLFQRQAEINLVTGHIAYSDWVTENNSFEAYDVPSVKGYTANREVISGIDGVTVDSANFDVTIYYIKAVEPVTCRLLDVTTGEELATQKLAIRSTKKITEEIDRYLEPYFAKGYYIEKPAVLNLALQNPDLTDVTVELTQRVLEVSPDQPKVAHSLVEGYVQVTWPAGLETSHLTTTVSREIRLAYVHGDALQEPISQEITFTRSAQVNLVTGQVTYGDWQTEDATFAEVHLPEVDGYSPKRTTIPEETVTATTLNQVIDITYYEQPKRIIIDFVDHNADQVLASDELFGAIGEVVPYQVADKLVALGLADYDFLGANFPAELVISQEEQRYSVWLAARELGVSADEPHAPYTTTMVEGYGLFTWPYGVDRDDLTSTVKRRLHYKDDFGNHVLETPFEQEITFTRSATVNAVTKDIFYGDWQSLDPVFPAVTLPVLDGYDPETTEIAALELSDLSELSDRVIDVTVIYHRQPYHLQLTIINQLSREILNEISLSVASLDEVSVTINNQLEHYQKQGYSLVTELPNLEDWSPGQERQITLGLKPQLVTVTVEQIKEDYKSFDAEVAEQLRALEGLSPLELSREVVRKIRYLYANGRTVAPTYVDSITFKRTAKVNLVTGDIFFDDWTSYYPVFDEVLSPVCEGYTPSKEVVESIEQVTADSQNIAQTIIYTRNIQQVIVNVIDKSTGNIIYAESITGTNGDYSPTYNLANVVQKGYDLVSSQEPQPLVEAAPAVSVEPVVVETPVEVPVVEAVVAAPTVAEEAVPVEESVTPEPAVEEPTEVAEVLPVEESTPVIEEEQDLEEQEQTPPPVIETVVEVNFNDNEKLATYGIDPHSLVKACRRSISYTYDDGRQAAEPIRQELTYYRKALVNPENATVTYTDWVALDESIFAAVESPVFDGYEADQTVVEEETPNLAEKVRLEVAVTYHKRRADQLSVIFVDEATGDELMNFNFPNKGHAYVEGKINKGVSFLAYKGYKVVSSDYPDKPEVIDENTELFKVYLSQENAAPKPVEEVSKTVVASKPLPAQVDKVVTKQVTAVSPSEGVDKPVAETNKEPSQSEEKAKKKNKGFFSFLFKD